MTFELPISCPRCGVFAKTATIHQLNLSYNDEGKLVVTYKCECNNRVTQTLELKKLEHIEAVNPTRMFPNLPKGLPPAKELLQISAPAQPPKINWTTQDHKFLKAMKISTEEEK